MNTRIAERINIGDEFDLFEVPYLVFGARVVQDDKSKVIIRAINMNDESGHSVTMLVHRKFQFKIK